MPEARYKRKRLDALADINPESLPSNTPAGFRFRYIDLTAAKAGNIDWSAVEETRRRDAPSRAQRMTRIGDVLFGTVRPNLQSHGYIDETEEVPFIASTGFAVVRAKSCVSDSGFLFHSLIGTDVAAQANRQAVGSNYPAVNDGHVREFAISAPLYDEQRAIARVLNTMDSAILRKRLILDKLKHVKQGLIHDLLTRGIDANGEVRPEQKQRPDLYQQTKLGFLPVGWEPRLLCDVASRITDGTHQAVTMVKSDTETVPFLFVSCIRDADIIWEKAARISRTSFQLISKGREPHVGMVLYTAVGSYGHAAEVEDSRDFAFQRHIACIYPLASEVARGFVSTVLNWEHTRRYADTVALGNAQKTVTLGELAYFPFPCPPIHEQAAIVRRIRAVQQEIQIESATVNKLAASKAGLMADLLAGHVRVTSLLEK